jgi:hypothetical protein
VSIWCGCHDPVAHANDPRPEADWVVTMFEDGHLRPAPAPRPVISKGQFRDLLFAADLSYLTTSGTDAMRVRAAVTTVLTDLGYDVEASDG